MINYLLFFLLLWSTGQFVAGSQPVNAIAFVLDGLYYGVSDFEFAAYSMVSIMACHCFFLQRTMICDTRNKDFKTFALIESLLVEN